VQNETSAAPRPRRGPHRLRRVIHDGVATRTKSNAMLAIRGDRSPACAGGSARRPTRGKHRRCDCRNHAGKGAQSHAGAISLSAPAGLRLCTRTRRVAGDDAVELVGRRRGGRVQTPRAIFASRAKFAAAIARVGRRSCRLRGRGGATGVHAAGGAQRLVALVRARRAASWHGGACLRAWSCSRPAWLIATEAGMPARPRWTWVTSTW
jgi:hypothetical protein